jgi:hypothetical protein
MRGEQGEIGLVLLGSKSNCGWKETAKQLGNQSAVPPAPESGDVKARPGTARHGPATPRWVGECPALSGWVIGGGGRWAAGGE